MLEWGGTLPDIGEVHDLQMLLVTGKTIWTITCTTFENYSASEDTFYDILRSFRIYK